jgi:hypothetical protein
MEAMGTHPPFTRNYPLTDRTKSGAFGATAGTQHAGAQRAERGRLEKERLDREGQEYISQLTEEQREEINEAVWNFSF